MSDRLEQIRAKWAKSDKWPTTAGDDVAWLLAEVDRRVTPERIAEVLEAVDESHSNPASERCPVSVALSEVLMGLGGSGE